MGGCITLIHQHLQVSQFNIPLMSIIPPSASGGEAPGQSAPAPGRIIVVNGYPGVGKLTILKQLYATLPPATTCLFDNHLLIDPVVAIFPGRGERHHALRSALRAPLFAALAERARAGDTVLMTACMMEEVPTDVVSLAEHVDMVRDSDATLYWVNLSCDSAVLHERVQSSQRTEGGKPS